LAAVGRFDEEVAMTTLRDDEIETVVSGSRFETTADADGDDTDPTDGDADDADADADDADADADDADAA
jgi:hypothetical protein